MKLNVLVTGASGFIGKNVTEYLQKSGIEVTGLLHSDKGQKYPFRTMVCNLNEHIELDEGFDVIVHCAGVKPRRDSEIASYGHHKTQLYKQGNVDTMENIIAFAKRIEAKRIVNLSSIGVYGDIKSPVVNEDTDIINPDQYGITKYIAECLLRDSGIENISLRCPGIIGKGASDIWFTNAIRKIQNNEDIMVYSPDFETANFVWIEDLAAFIRSLIIRKSLEYDTIVIGSEKKTTVRKMVSRMFDYIDSHSQIIENDSIRAPFCIDSLKAVSLGYKSCEPEDIVGLYLQNDGS